MTYIRIIILPTVKQWPFYMAELRLGKQNTFQSFDNALQAELKNTLLELKQFLV